MFEPVRWIGETGEIGEAGSAGVLSLLPRRDDRAVPRAVRRIEELLPPRRCLIVEDGGDGFAPCPEFWEPRSLSGSSCHSSSSS